MTAQIAATSSQNDMDRLFPKAQRKPFTVGEVINDTMINFGYRGELSNKWDSVKCGDSVSNGFADYKLSPNNVSFTVRKGGQFWHWSKPYPIAINGLSMLSSFPQLFDWGRGKQLQIGNSVPPLFMKAIATQIRHVMFGGQPLESTAHRNEYLEILEEAWRQHLKPRAEDAPTVISTFAGCGGSSLGYSMAGFRELLAVEWDDNAVETFKLNFPDVPVYHGDIAKLSVKECLDLAGIEPGELDILDGSPPCQGFSTAGKRNMSDDRNQLFREYVRLLRGLQPKVFVMENVSGMVKGKMKLIFAEVMRELKASGYRVSCRLLNAMYFNVPQSRQRLIFIGVRDDLNIEPTHPKAERKAFTVGEAFQNMENLGIMPVISDKHSYPKMIKRIPKGDSIGKHFGKGFNWIRIDNNKPCPSLPKSTTYGGLYFLFVSNGSRSLSEREAARCGSFPDNFRFVGKYPDRIARIGNSVPPLFMRSIARHIRETILIPERIPDA